MASESRVQGLELVRGSPGRAAVTTSTGAFQERRSVGEIEEREQASRMNGTGFIASAWCRRRPQLWSSKLPDTQQQPIEDAEHRAPLMHPGYFLATRPRQQLALDDVAPVAKRSSAAAREWPLCTFSTAYMLENVPARVPSSCEVVITLTLPPFVPRRMRLRCPLALSHRQLACYLCATSNHAGRSGAQATPRHLRQENTVTRLRLWPGRADRRQPAPSCSFTPVHALRCILEASQSDLYPSELFRRE